MKMKTRSHSETLGKLMKDIREEAGVSQRLIAERLGYEGPTVVHHIESGRREVRLWEFMEFCDATEQRPEEIFNEYLKRTTGLPRRP